MTLRPANRSKAENVSHRRDTLAMAYVLWLFYFQVSVTGGLTEFPTLAIIVKYHRDLLAWSGQPQESGSG